MRITPLDIYQQEFKKTLRGVDPDEVEDFLDRVADDYEEVIEENAALKKQVESLKAQLSAGAQEMQVDGSEAEVREEAGSVIREARREAENVIREATKEADSIIRKAREEALEIRSEARKIHEDQTTQASGESLSKEEAKMEQIELRREISRLRAQKEHFLIEYRELLEKHLKFLTEEE